MQIRNTFKTLIFLSLTISFSHTAFAAQTTEERIQQLEQQLAELKEAIKVKPAVTKKETKIENKKSESNYKFGGFIKATASYSSYSEGDLAAGSAGRDFYIPGLIPVGTGGINESSDFDFSAKETRINFKSDHNLNGNKLSSFIEMDFLLGPGGNERVSNSYNPRMRHAFLKYNNWLFGQTWSTFQNVGALPESVDFLAASEGTIFERQPMIRYTSGNWQFALENPETTVTPFGGGGRIVTDDASIPDFVARYSFGNITAAALFRSLSYEDVGSNIDDSESSYGISLSGKHKFGAKNDFRWMLSTGAGMGRYAGLNTANAAVLDANGNLNAIDSTLGFAAVRWFYNDMWRSNLIFSTFSADNDTALTGTGVTQSAQSLQFNVLYSPASKLTLGLGYLYADRELESGIDGDLGRLIFSAKYAF